MTQAQHAALPEYVLVRLVDCAANRPGHRTHLVQLLTTLLDAKRYSSHAFAELYAPCWQIETNPRHLKETLGLDLLRSETPAGVEKEIVMFVIVYNLVRSVMVAEGQRRGVAPDRVSFLDTLRALSWPILGADAPLLINPLRPGRVEPRLRNRRPKKYSLTREPRAVLKERLMKRWSA